MLAYRHAFHAGNHADVLKHAVLLACLSHLQQKPGPVLVVDTHAGAGAYTPDGPLTRQKSEWHTGLGRLWPMREDNMPSLVRHYVQAVRAAQPGPAADQPLVLPGSPWLISHQLRSQDAIRCCEAHPTDFPLLQAMLAPLGRRAQALQKDGFESLKAWLPPASRRGLVLMDPSYELKSDYPQALKSLRDAMTRFATGCYVIWVPMVARLEVDRFVRQAMALPASSRLLVSLKVRSPVKDGLGLMGSHLIVLNPPFGLQASLEEALPWLVKQLGQDSSARFEISQQETGGPKPPRPTTPRSTGRAAPSRPGSLKRLS